MHTTAPTDFDPVAEAHLVVTQLTDDQLLRYFGTADRRQAVSMLAAERAMAGPARATALTVMTPDQLGTDEQQEGIRVRTGATRSLDRVLRVVKVTGLVCSAIFLLLGILAMAGNAMMENYSWMPRVADLTLAVLAVISGVSMVLGFLLMVVAQMGSRLAENRRRRAQLEWASWRPGREDEPGQLGRGLPGVSLPEVMGGWNMGLNRLAAALAVLGVLAVLACGFLAWAGMQEKHWGMLVTGLLGLVPGLAAVWAGWKLPGWHERRARRDWELARALTWRS